MLDTPRGHGLLAEREVVDVRDPTDERILVDVERGAAIASRVLTGETSAADLTPSERDAVQTLLNYVHHCVARDRREARP